MSFIVLNCQVVEWLDIFANPVFKNPGIDIFSNIDSDYPILKYKEKWTILTVVLSTKFHVIHITKFIISTIHIFLCDHNQWKTQIKKGHRFLHREKTTKVHDHLPRKDWVEFQGEHLFSLVELSKSVLKAFRLQKGPSLPLLRRPAKITATFEVAALCAVGDAQCKTRALP